MLLTLYDSNGNEKVRIELDDSSTQDKEIQGDNLLKLSFTLYDFVAIDVNDYVDYGGERYWAVEKYAPSEKSTVQWEYGFQLYGIESLIKRFLVLNLTDGGNEAVFILTARPIDHVRLIVKNINDGMDGTANFKVGAVEGTDNVTIDYTGKYCNDGLKELAEAVGTEWWFDGETLNLCRCEHGEEITLGYDKGLTALDRDKADNAKFYTRLFPIGSSRNIDASKYGHSRLMLPGGAKYVDVNVEKYGIIHHYEQSAFAGIYPRRVGVVGGVRHEEVKDKDGKPFTIYYFRDNDLPFDPNDYEIGGLVKRVSFQEGSELAGLGTDNDHYFEVNFNSDTREFEIITIWPYEDDTQLPGGTLVPKAGDKYILWNIGMPDEYYSLAEQELRSAVDEYNRKHALDVSRYKAPTDHVWMEDTGTELFIGRRIRLESREYFPETGYRQSRITRISRKVNLPGQMDLEISDSLSTGAMTKIDDAITGAKNYAGALVGAINVPDIIRSWDTTPPTDTNLYSARRMLKEFLNKNTPDVALGLITFLGGIAFGDGVSGIDADGVARLRALLLDNASIDAEGHAELKSVVSGMLSSPGFSEGLTDGTGAGIYRDANGKWVVEADKLLVRLKMIVSMLEVRRLSYVGGDQVHSSAGSHITKTRILPSGDIRCYILADDGSTRTMNDWRVGDQAKCKTDNIKEGVYENVSNKYYWRLVVNTGEEVLDDGKVYNYVDLSDTRGTVKLTVEGVEHTCVGYDTSVDNDLPAEGDDIVQLGSQTDKERQYAYVIYVTEGKRVDYAGINDYDLNSHIVELHSKSGGFVHSDRFEIVSAAGTGVSQPIVCERGTWQSGMVYGHYDHVSHDNATWLNNVGRGRTTTSEPADGNPDWIKETYGMKGEGLTQLLLGLTSGDWFWREGQGIIATVEVAVVQGDTDITGTIHPSQLVWTRSSAATGTEDADWAARHTGDSFSLTVLADDMVGDVTTFICTLYSANGEHIQSNSITI
jgi:hypothetical protein